MERRQTHYHFTCSFPCESDEDCFSGGTLGPDITLQRIFAIKMLLLINSIKEIRVGLYNPSSQDV